MVTDDVGDAGPTGPQSRESQRILLDNCIWPGVIGSLAAEGYDVEWVGHWPEDPGDAAILDWAFGAKRVLITLDNGFGRLAVHHGRPHCGIVRLVDFRAREQAPVALKVLAAHADELASGAIVTATPRRFRVRPGSRA